MHLDKVHYTNLRLAFSFFNFESKEAKNLIIRKLLEDLKSSNFESNEAKKLIIIIIIHIIWRTFGDTRFSSIFDGRKIKEKDFVIENGEAFFTDIYLREEKRKYKNVYLLFGKHANMLKCFIHNSLKIIC